MPRTNYYRDPIRERVNEVIKMIRIQLTLQDKTQRWLAEQIGITEETMSRKIHGHKPFEFKEIVLIAGALKLDEVELGKAIRGIK